ncbi:MAG: hypothetical protein DRI84_00825 [Bacteroidetes bacterium]|nr:MAG: hypothetical protein DRI84_00825 [Bacteroidota bacterium]
MKVLKLSITGVVLITSFFLAVSCESDSIPDEPIELEGIVEQLKANGLENIVIPHRIDDFERMKMVQQMGFTAWELDLVFYTDSSKSYFSVKHNQDSTQAPTLKEYLAKVDFDVQKKLWLDIKNINTTNFTEVKLQLDSLDVLYKLKDVAIIESDNRTVQMALLSAENWHTAYYLPYWNIVKWIDNNDTIAQLNYANELSQQLQDQKSSSISFDVLCYPFVKGYLEKKISKNIVYHCWDLSLDLGDTNFIEKYLEQHYAADSRIKTVLIPI